MRHLLAALALWFVTTAAEAQILFDADQFGRVDLATKQSAGTTARLIESLGARVDRFEPIADFPTDDPIRVLGRKVGRLDILMQTKRGERGTAVCTATLIDTDKIITNHHCVPGPAGARIEDVRVRFGYLERGTKDSTAFVVQKVPIEASEALDYAVLRVEGKPGETFGTAPLNIRTARANERLFIIHHPAGEPQKLTRAFCRVHPKIAIDGHELRHQCDTLPGSSGSLIFSQTDNALVALHNLGGLTVGDATSFNSGIDASALAKMRVFASLCCAPKEPPASPPLASPPQVRIPIPPLPPPIAFQGAPTPSSPPAVPPSVDSSGIVRISPSAVVPPPTAPAPTPSAPSSATATTKGLFSAPVGAPAPAPPGPTPSAPGPRSGSTTPVATSPAPAARVSPTSEEPLTKGLYVPPKEAPATSSTPPPSAISARSLASAMIEGPTYSTYEDKVNNLARTFKGHRAGVKTVAFSPNGGRFASGAVDGVIKVWNSNTGETIATIDGFDQAIDSVSFTPDGLWIVALSARRNLRIWDAATFRELRSWSPAPSTHVSSLSADKRLAIVRDQQNGISLWSVVEERKIKSFTRSERGSTIFAERDNAALTIGERFVELWDIDTELTIRRFAHRGIYDVTIGHSGRLLRTYAYDNRLAKVWEVESGKEIAAFSENGNSYDRVISPDGSLFAMALCDRYSSVKGCLRGSAQISITSTGRVLRDFTKQTNYVKAVAFSPDGKFLLSGSDDTTIMLWDISKWASVTSTRPAAKP